MKLMKAARLFTTFILGSALALTGCLGTYNKDKTAEEKKPIPEAPNFNDVTAQNDEKRLQSLSLLYTPDDLQKALRAAALKVVKRLPTAEEINQARQGLSSYSQVISSYLETPEFSGVIRKHFQETFKLAGTATVNGVQYNYNEPANLATYLVKNDMDYREVITATYCVDDNLNTTDCSSFSRAGNPAEHAAGAITTAGFLQKWNSAFNLFRTREAFQNFACQTYPNETDPGMRVELIAGDPTVATFNCTSCEPKCYGCHKSMNPIGAVFFHFDRKGFFNPLPNDQRAPDEFITRVIASQVASTADILNNNAQPTYHGEPINSVREYAMKFSNNKVFRDCVAQRFTNFILGNNYMDPIPAELNYLKDKVSAYGYRVKPILKEVLQSRTFVLVK